MQGTEFFTAQIRRTWLLATLICGTLDIGFALGANGIKGASPGAVLRGIAVGPFGKAAKDWGSIGAIAGLAVHFAIMAAMVIAFLVAVRRRPEFLRRPVICGALYGAFLYFFMYWIVIPLRWPSASSGIETMKIAMDLLPHVVLVGIPMALIASRRMG